MPRPTAAVCVFPWNSLRIGDQPLLAQAASTGPNTLLNMHVFDPSAWDASTAKGQQRASAQRAAFYVDSVLSLEARLAAAGSGLLFLRGNTPALVAQTVALLSETHAVCRVLVEEANTVEEQHTLAAINKQVSLLNLAVTLEVVRNAATMVRSDAFERKPLPPTFTQFRVLVEKAGPQMLRKVVQTPRKLPPMPAVDWSKSEIADSIFSRESANIAPLSIPDPRSAFPFAAGEESALNRIKNYFEDTQRIRSYKETRNELIGSEYSSKLSPFLAFGSVSASTVLNLLKKHEASHKDGGNESTYWLFFELLWRDYFQFLGKQVGSKLYHLYGIGSSSSSNNNNPPQTWIYNQELFNAWKTGTTGIPFVDANMRELLHTGFMSNRGRQNVASFLVRDLNIPWTYGAEWFEQQLLDHDPCSNYGNWQYVAGVGNDPRSDRYFNVIKQAKDYDPQGDFVKLWCPELKELGANVIHHPWVMRADQLKLGGVQLGVTYPKPIVEAEAWKKHYFGYSTKGKLGSANPSEKVRRHRK
ncbi:cryptochrome DASH-like protein [Obelidium mucronatum]|nr:cryptochrome DASH-like protein [Obelidium mucronatum]